MREINLLISLIDDFLGQQIDGIKFEKQFSEIYDLEEFQFDPANEEYLKEIRLLLEKYSPYKSDLQNHPTYYIDDLRLRDEILKLNRKLQK